MIKESTADLCSKDQVSEALVWEFVTELVVKFIGRSGGMVASMNLISLNEKKNFTYQEAQALLPVIYRITKNYFFQVNNLIKKADVLRTKKPEQASVVENEIQTLIDTWHDKVTKLGAKPKGLWLADFDNGQGYYCWKFPETELLYEHGYNDGFTGRRLVNPTLHQQ